LFCGTSDEWRVLDPRANNNLRDLPDVVQQVRILDISPPIPNDAVAFRSQFPSELRTQVEAIFAGLADEAGVVWNDSVGLLYQWDGINPADDSDWDWFKEAVLDAAGFSIDDL
jgi:ABC-type phosphate/phosphonate transport system substrate-binding protein